MNTQHVGISKRNHRLSALVALSLVAGLSAPVLAQFSVVDPGTPVAGFSQAEWSVKWWTHFAAIPASVNPILDTTGENAFRGDVGRVFFLAGTFGGTANRTVSVRPDQYLFFPLIAGIYTQGDPVLETEEYMRRSLADTVDTATNLTLETNDDGFGNPAGQRQQSPAGLFLTVVDSDNILGNPSGTYNSVADGFWVMLEPLPEGTHQLSFGGKIPGETPESDFEVLANYTINVVVPEPTSTGLLAISSLALARRTRRSGR